MAKAIKNSNDQPIEAAFSKERLLKSARYQHRRDVLNSVLSNEKTYSHADVEDILQKFMESKVK